MSNYDFNRNPDLVKQVVEQSRKASDKFFDEHPNSVVLQFENELYKLGFCFEIPEQIKLFLPSSKEKILPIAIKFYQQAELENEKNFFISLFHYRGFEEAVPLLLKDFYAEETTSLTRQFIGETLRAIHSKKYVEEYLNIISNQQYGLARAPLFSLIGSLKEEKAIPVLIRLLDTDREFAPCALQALGAFRCQKLRPYFERYINSSDKDLCKAANLALKKLNH